MNSSFSTFISSILKQQKKVVNTDKQYMIYAQAVRVFVSYYKELDINKDKKRATINFLVEVYVPLRGEDNLLSSTLFTDVAKVKDTLEQLPRRNLGQYRELQLPTLVDMNIPEKDRVSQNTLASYLKYISRFYNFCKAQQYITINPCHYVSISKSINSVDERQAFTKEEVGKLLKVIDDNCDLYKQVIYYTLIYTGMRISELYKAEIKLSDDGLYYFDLTNPSIKLKTKSSHRLLPFHSKLIKIDAMAHLPVALARYKLNWIRRVFNEKLKHKVTTSPKKVLYSLRHTVASELKFRRVNSLVISEILGHSHEGMTMGRYACRYPLQVLKEAIDLLEY